MAPKGTHYFWLSARRPMYGTGLAARKTSTLIPALLQPLHFKGFWQSFSGLVYKKSDSNFNTVPSSLNFLLVKFKCTKFLFL